MTGQQLAQIYADYLDKKGYHPETEEGFVRFRHAGGVYLVAVDANDEEYFRLIFPNFWEITDDAERQKVLRACDTATAETKVAKVFIVRDNVWGTIEIFCPEIQQFQQIFDRSMSALRAAVNKFVEEMKK